MNPRLFKFIVSLIVVTAAALVYVHQQVEMVKLSYALDIKEKALKDALDYRENLSYDIYNLNAPTHLEKVLAGKKMEMVLPKRYQVVKIAKAPSAMGLEARLIRSGVEKRANIFGIFELLGLKTEAQAKER